MKRTDAHFTGRRTVMRRYTACAATMLALLLTSLGAAAQTPVQGGAHMSREALTEALAQLEEVAASPAHPARVRSAAEFEASLISYRLREGDFQVGDRVYIVVQGEAALSDTFAIAAGRMLHLSGFEPISVAGVLRSELVGHLQRELGRYLREPSVQARTMLRLSITGEVASQGFFVIPTDVALSDALMLAGGPTSDARLDGIRMLRGRDVIIAPEQMVQAMNAGFTLDQLNLRAGDQIVVPARGGAANLLRNLSLALPIVTLLIALVL